MPAGARFVAWSAAETQQLSPQSVEFVDEVILLLFDRDDGWAPTPTFLNIYVDDCDAAHQRALEVGAAEVTPLSTNAWGQRGSRLRDPFGNLWWVQTHVEDVSEEDMAERMGQQHYIDDLAVALDTLDLEMKSRFGT